MWRVIYFCSWRHFLENRRKTLLQPTLALRVVVQVVMLLQLISRIALGQALFRRNAILHIRLAPHSVHLDSPKFSHPANASFWLLYKRQVAIERDLARLRYRLHSMKIPMAREGDFAAGGR